jgi:hypothetical protein
MYLGVQLFQALGQDPHSTAVRRYSGWIDRLGDEFAEDSRSNLPLNDIGDRLLAQLEVISFSYSSILAKSSVLL